MLDEVLMEFQVSGLATKEEALTYLADKMVRKGIVHPSYVKAILEREVQFPTGLQFEEYGLAIPHADVEHVIESELAVLTLEEPVTFYQMGTQNTPVEVGVIFMLALKEAHQQLELLQGLVSLLQDAESMKAISQLTNQPDSARRLKAILKSKGIE